MTTPTFTPQDSSSISTVRFYTQFDPYYYSTDNRPLQDLDTNIRQVASSGGDSARRAILLTELGLSDVFRHLFTTTNTAGYATGLGVTNPTGTTIQIQPGAWYFLDAVNDSISTSIVKQALLLAPTQLSIPSPGVAGQSINYLVEISSNTLTSANMLTSSLPFLDNTNSMLPGLLLNGELIVHIKAGTAAATGSQTTPTADSGFTPLYIVTSTYGASAPTVQMSTSGAPSMPGLSVAPTVQYPLTGAATATAVGGLPIAALPSGSTTAIVASIAFSGKQINPTSPIKVSLLVSSTGNTGYAQLQLKYLSIAEGGSTSAAAVSLSTENMVPPSTANTLATYTMTGMIPASSFSSFVSNLWKISSDKLNLTISRNGATDTLAAPLYIHDIILSQ
jgi:hypothetical protein